MKIIKRMNLPEKYEFVRVLGRGLDNTTYLVRHKQLGSYLALKTLSDSHSSPAQLSQEINLIKNLNHPGIPKIIDIIEEEQLYVLQEYIPGTSLEEYLSNKISLQQFLSISGQLVSIIYYLHNLDTEPILYLDFKPEHIKVFENQVFLLDYGMAQKCKDKKVAEVYFGTEEFSAPEVKEKHCATVQSDIYSLGKILEKMLNQVVAKTRREKARLLTFRKVVRKCMEEREEYRYENVEEILFQLRQTTRIPSRTIRNKTLHLRLTVAVIGTHHGVGTTHVATGLTHCYNQMGKKGIYVESECAQWLRQSSLSRSLYPKMNQVADFVKKGNFVGLPAYGPYYEPMIAENGVYIRDLGVIWDGFSPDSYDRVVVVIGSRFWEEEVSLKQLQALRHKENCLFVCSGASGFRVKELVKISGVPIYSWGYDEDVFHMSKEKMRIMNRLLGKDIYV